MDRRGGAGPGGLRALAAVRAGQPEPDRGTKWDRELAAFASLYGWAVKNAHVTRNLVAVKQVRGRNGEVVTAPAARRTPGRPNVHRLTRRTWRRWIDVALRGHGRDGVPEPGWAGRLEDRNVAFTRLHCAAPTTSRE